MRLQNKFDLRGDDTGVSPVVGVILMVAITVILAAVIANFVLGLGGQVQQNAQAGVTFDENVGNSVDVQLNSVQSADHIYVTASESGASFSGGAASSIDGSSTYSDGPSSANQWLLTVDDEGTSDTSDDTEVGGAGTTVTVDTSGSSDGTISVIGVLEGSENVIQTFEYTGGA